MLCDPNLVPRQVVGPAQPVAPEQPVYALPVTSVVSVAKILIVIDHSECRPDFLRETFHIEHATPRSALQSILNFEPDVIFVSDEFYTYHDQRIAEIKKLAARNCIPFILHSSKFNANSKQIASDIGFDDYHFGNITAAFEKRINFLQRLKSYRKQRIADSNPTSQNYEAPRIKSWNLKRSYDIIFSAIALLLLSPLMLIITILIKLDSAGPVFYISKRAGSGYKIFNFYKFRTMRTGADLELKKLAHMNQYADAGPASGTSVFYKLKNDPRVTRLGRFLRDTSLDELPQLLNVIKGDMSLIGNRPLPLYEAERLTSDKIAGRFLAPAGISGLWQVSKRGKAKMSEEERIDLDIEYARNTSFLFDMKILFSTIPSLLQKEKV
jgi:lipopolysaccharide/colanic/teichoic acid biosynthesis glycosyltransferase